MYAAAPRTGSMNCAIGEVTSGLSARCQDATKCSARTGLPFA
jgi:hypothetical protein